MAAPHHHPARLSPARALTMLGITVVILGINWPIMKQGLESIDPLWFAFVRVTAAGMVVTAVAAAMGRLRPPPREDWPVVLSVGLAGTGIHLAILFTALQYVPAGRSSVLVWTAALWTVPIASVALQERMSPRRWVGLIAGIAGIVLLFEPWRFAWSDGDVVLGNGLLLGTAVLQGAVIVHTRAHRWRTGPTDALPWQMLTAAVPLLVAALAIEGPLHIDWSVGFAGIVAYQAVLATGFSAWSRQIVVLSLRATTVSLVMMAIPLVGIVASVVALDENVTFAAAVGVAAIGIGVAMSVLAERVDPIALEAQPID
ncbi:MAG: DMT family transporter [Acidimicrobiia bacterium]|nr:DMT family transporter [Acidimicrobiia bacterium]